MRVRRFASAVLAICICFSSAANARPERPRFEPTDLELEVPGTVEVDLQLGAARGEGAAGSRMMIPDFEIDIGLLPNVELDLDGTLTLDRFDSSSRTIGSDPLWLAVKLGLVDLKNGTSARAFGVQLGPRFPWINGGRGIGYEALALAGIVETRLHAVVSAGALIDPGDGITYGRPKAIVCGASLDLDLDSRDRWSLLVQVGSALYARPDPNELTLGAGASLSVTPSLDVSAILLGGALPGGDRVMLLLGVSPKFTMW